MKLREIYKENKQQVNEYSFVLPLVGSVLWFVKAYYIFDAVKDSYLKITDLQSQFEQKQISLAKRDSGIEHELAKFSLELGALFVGSKMIGLVTDVIPRAFGANWFVSELMSLAGVVPQYKFMQWVSTDKVRQLISDFLTGQIFTQLKIIGKAGPLYEKYVGSGLKSGLEGAETGIKDTIKQTTGVDLSKPVQPTQAASKTPANVPPPPDDSTSPYIGKGREFAPTEYDPSNPEDPYRVNIRRTN